MNFKKGDQDFMKRIILLLMLSVLFLCGCNEQNDLAKIKQIQFKDSYADEDAPKLNASAEIIGLSLTEMQVPKTVQLYSVKMRKYEPDSAEMRAITSFLNIPHDQLQIRSLNDDGSAHHVSYNSENMWFSMTDGYLFQYQLPLSEKEQWVPVTASQEELIKASLEIMAQIPYLDGEYQFEKMGQQTISSDTKSSTYMRTCQFNRVLDGKVVEGGGECWVGFSAKGFCYLRVTYYDYSPCGSYDIISPETASESLHTPQIFNTQNEKIDVTSVSKLDVQQCELVYDNECAQGYDTVQPFYRITGSAYNRDGDSDAFALYIPALDEKYFE